MKALKTKKSVVIPPEPVLLTLKQLTAFLNVSESTVRKWTKNGMPTAIRTLKTLRYDRRACLAWLAEENNTVD